MTTRILVGDVFEQLASLPSNSVDCCVTSPPYWGLRSYMEDGRPEKRFEIGLEPTLGEHLDVMVRVFREVRRVLKAQGTCWLNYGDCYAAAPNGKSAAAYKADGTDDRTFRDKPFSTVGPIYEVQPPGRQDGRRGRSGNLGNGGINGIAIPQGRVVAGGFLKPKDLCMIPNRLAIALQDDGWYVRSEIIWHKPNPMPESVYDRPTSAHEKVWLLSKSGDYFYNHEAIREQCSPNTHARVSRGRSTYGRHTLGDAVPEAERRDGTGQKAAAPGSGIKNNKSFSAAIAGEIVETRNARNVWTIAPKAFREAHFATFPPALAERCIKAGVPMTVCGYCGAPEGCGGICGTFPRVPGVVLDPFGGAGTVGLVAQDLGCDAILIELNPGYAEITRRRLGLVAPEAA